jgi:PAS domain S-box-containing protein
MYISPIPTERTLYIQIRRFDFHVDKRIIIKSMNVSILKEIENKKLDFRYLPEFSAFILQNFLKEFTETLIEFSKEEKVPILKFFETYTEEEFLAYGIKSSEKLLTSLALNQAYEYIQESSESYQNNLIPFLAKEAVLAEDITLISLVRRKGFRKYLHYYTQDIKLFGEVMEELDKFVAFLEMSGFNAFIKIQEESLSRVNQDLNQKNEDLLEAETLAEMGSFLWDIKSKASITTPGVIKILGIKPSGEFENFLNYVHEEDKQKVTEDFQESYRKGGMFESEYRFLVGGKEKKIWSRGKVEFDEEGNPERMKGTVMDVTKRHDLLNQLQESESINKHIQTITHIGNWSWDITEDVVVWSDEMYRIYGLEPQSEAITLNRFLSFLHPDDKEQRLCDIRQSLKTGKANDYVIRIVLPDGTLKYLRGKGEVLLDASNKPIKLIGSCQDITIEQNLINEIKEKENYFTHLINNAPDGVIVFDKLGRIRLWNPKSEEIFGYKADEVIGKKISETIFPMEYKDQYEKVLLDLVEKENTLYLNKDLELTAIDMQQKELYVSCRISHAPHEETSPYIVFVKDITLQRQTKKELKFKTMLLEQLNQSLEHKNSELESINKELQSFNYVASHDLQEPLRKIRLFANRIVEKNGLNLPGPTRDYLSKIMESTDRMKSLIEDLLTFSQASASESSFQHVDLKQIMIDVLHEFSDSIEERKAVVEYKKLPVVWGIPFQLHQLFSNLMSNAFKYCDKGISPCLQIKATVKRGSRIPFGEAIADKKYSHISIKDNGIGFDQEYSEKIFGLFQRLHAKDQYSGTGIGLAICKKIMNNHHGFIKAESTLNKGSVFHLFIPLYRINKIHNT